jgi:hypothetical protein
MGILVSSGDTDGLLEAVLGQRVQVIRQWRSRGFAIKRKPSAEPVL